MGAMCSRLRPTAHPHQSAPHYASSWSYMVARAQGLPPMASPFPRMARHLNFKYMPMTIVYKHYLNGVLAMAWNLDLEVMGSTPGH